MGKIKKVQSRTWGIIIPCEWEEHMKIVHHAKTIAKHYYWIMHSNDSYGDNETGNVGEIKKSHIHLLMTFSNSRDLSTVQNYFKDFENLKENSFEKISNAYGAKRYLIHADNPEKYQYSIQEVETNDRLFPNCFIEKMSGAEIFDNLLEAFDADFPTMREYCNNFRPVCIGLNAYQMSQLINIYRREWRLKNEYSRVQADIAERRKRRDRKIDDNWVPF